MSLRRLGRAGKTRYGCLVSLLVFAALLYYGVDVGGVFLRYIQVRDEMNQAARLGSRLDDDKIRARLHARMDALDVPLEAHRFNIHRYDRPPEILITSSYAETIELPFTHYTFHFHPVARAPL